MRVPDEAFRLAASIDLERFKGMSVHSAALLVLQGRPWLRVRVRPEAIQRDSRVNERGRRTSCWVRANRSYLAPILPYALQTQQ